MSQHPSKTANTSNKDSEGLVLPAAYDLHRTSGDDTDDIAYENRLIGHPPPNRGTTNTQKEQQQQHQRYSYAASSSEAASHSSDGDGYMDIRTAAGGAGGGDSGTVGTAGYVWHQETSQALNTSSSSAVADVDATDAVAEMHLALLYLLSHPHELERAVGGPSFNNNYNNNNTGETTTLQQWNAEYYYTDNDDQSLYTEAEPPLGCSSTASLSGATTTTTGAAAGAPPLPFAIFCDDAEVVLPQAHTASQLFGLETVTGMELEAAAGVVNVSRLFLRWLALMPGGDHLNLIDPPGLTVMKIAGGRYRVTAAHRVVWTWYNDLARVSDDPTVGTIHALKPGDLVGLTIVDVFETDNRGKLLSYCPTFDNRAVQKQDRAAHLLRKRKLQVQSALRTASNSALAVAVRRHAGLWATKLYQAVEDAVVHRPRSKDDDDDDHHGVTTIPGSPPRNMNLWVNPPQQITGNSNNDNKNQTTKVSTISSTAYHADDDMERHEV